MATVDWALLDGDPAPGDIEALTTAANVAGQVRLEAGDHLRQVEGILAAWPSFGWQGSAASRFQELLQGAARHLSQMEDAHGPVSQSLSGHARTLSEQQPIARRALEHATQATAQKATASQRREEARQRYTQAALVSNRAATELSRIENAITSRLQELESLGAHIIGSLFSIADGPLQALLGEKATWEAARSDAEEGMRAASGIIGDMEHLIEDADAALTAAVRLASEVRSEVEDSVKRALGIIGDVDSDLRGFWHHVEEGVMRGESGSVQELENLVMGIASGLGIVYERGESSKSRSSSFETRQNRRTVSEQSIEPTNSELKVSAAATSAVFWAESPERNSTNWDHRCLAFVFHAYKTSNNPVTLWSRFGTMTFGTTTYPEDVWTRLIHGVGGGIVHNHDDLSPPPGALVFWPPHGEYPGHVAISIGGGEVVTTEAGGFGGPGVTEMSIATLNSSSCASVGWWLPT